MSIRDHTSFIPDEAVVQRQCIDYLESIGFYVVKLIQTSKNGIPDLFCCRKKIKHKSAESFFVEVKRHGETAEPLQVRRHYELALHGMMTYVIDDVEKLKALIK